MRYRGAYEYDKYSLNILQLSNMVTEYLDDLENEESFKNLNAMHKEIDKIFKEYTEVGGISEKLYHKLTLFSEVN
jgi:hypothetical protein